MQGAGSSRHLLDQAERKFLQALRVCSELRGSSTLTESEYMAMKGRLLLNLGLVYDVRGAEKESTEYLQKSLTIAKQWHLEEEQFLCHFNSANQALRHSQPAAAQSSLQQALTIATRLQNKPRQKEVFCQLAIASVNAGDTKSAKHFLKKAYKLLPTTGESHKLVKLYKAVTTVEELSEQRSACSQEDQDMFSIHEKLGDAFTEIGMYCGSYATAVQHYQSMVECGERLGLGADKLIPAYVSLAQTYADNRQPHLAISSYHKELQLRGEDHEQISRTWLNIAELEEKKGDGYKVLSKTYMTAFTHARKANHPKLQVQVLRSLIATQETFKERRHKEQTEAKLKQVQARHGLRSGEGLSSEEEEDSPPQDSQSVTGSDREADVSISDLTDSEKSDEENIRPVLGQPVGTARIRRHKTFKKNEKGETPLHVACINGNVKRVRTLLAEGHPVNVRDHCGWTPLHEAANHNYPAIVEVLLDVGADINDRGGAECNGFTPLIDASACGNLDIVKVLIQRGANVLAKDDKGCTALQALRDWYRDYADTSDQDLEAQYNAVVLLFQEKVSGGIGRSKGQGSKRAVRESSGGSHPQPGPSHLDGASGLSTGASRLAGHSSQRSTATTTSKRRSPLQGSHSHRSPAQGLHSSSSRGIVKKHLPGDSASSDEGEADVYRNPQLEDLVASSQSATETYRSSILALGSSTQRAEVRASVSKPARRSQRDASQPALLSEQEMVGDDWLIDDLQPSSRKRRDRSSLGGMLSSDSVRPARDSKRARLTTKRRGTVTKPDCGDGIQTSETEDLNDAWLSAEESCHENGLSSPERDSHHNSRLSSSTKLSNSSMHRVVPVISDSCSGEEEESLPRLTNSVRRMDASVRTLNVMDGEVLCGEQTEQAPRRLSDGQRVGEDLGMHLSLGDPAGETGGHFVPPPSATTVPTQLARVKVRIEGSVFLIPLPATEEKTVGWLSEEASQRYSSHFGKRPFLTLSSSDGAILSTDDVLSYVLSRDEQLDGTVHGWDQPALSERYTQACKTLNTVRYRNICGILSEAETSHQLSLSGLGLRSTVLLPISRALRGETTLTQLFLPDNHLGDNGLQVLAASLGDLKALTQLSLSGNNITAAGFRHLADLFPAPAGSRETTCSTSGPLQMLETLDVSHNPLGSSIADCLCRVVGGLSSLSALMMSSCGLTARLFQHNRPALAACLQGRNIQQLGVSHNHLGTLGVELLLWSINAQNMTSLDLGHTCPDPNPGHLALHLKVFVNQDCGLQSLSLENCSLNQEDIDFICRLPQEVPSLQKLNVSLNRALTRDSLQALLRSSSRCAHSQLRHLQAQSCSIGSPLSAPCPLQSSSNPTTTVTASFLETLQEKLSSPYPLQHLTLPCVGLDKLDRERLSDVWMQRWAQGTVEFSAQSVLLSLKQPC
ncbi:tonsoku-like protein [Babylonia areolata]|uniref:tonsoku-like protein n=1 Tax=Babylonia areolata TaxID=304850 RepID=UPI003FD13D08